MVAYIHFVSTSVRLPHSFIYLLCVLSYTKHFCSKMESLGNAVLDNGLYSLWEVWTSIFSFETDSNIYFFCVHISYNE